MKDSKPPHSELELTWQDISTNDRMTFTSVAQMESFFRWKSGQLEEQKEADALAWDRAVRGLSTQVVGLREALEFYAARHRYHSECCGNCINSDGGATARAALSNPASSDVVHNLTGTAVRIGEDGVQRAESPPASAPQPKRLLGRKVVDPAKNPNS